MSSAGVAAEEMAGLHQVAGVLIGGHSFRTQASSNHPDSRSSPACRVTAPLCRPPASPDSSPRGLPYPGLGTSNSFLPEALLDLLLRMDPCPF